MRPGLLIAVALSTMGAPLAAQSDSTWRDHDRAADAALARGDWGDARRHLLEVDRLLGGHPGAALALARTELRRGDTAAALGQLRRIATMGVTSRGTGDSAFDGVRSLPGFRDAVAAIAANAATIGAAQVVATLPDSAAIAEDLAWDAHRRRFIVSDVHGRRLWWVDLNGRTGTLGAALPPGWGMLAVAVDARRGVAWATAVTLPQAAGYSAADSGRAAILRLSLRDGAVLHRFEFPSPSRSAPGDLVVAENGDVFAGDGRTGAVHVIRAGRDALEALVPAGLMRGTQQPAVAPDGRTLYVADYGRGIARVNRSGGAVRWLGRAGDVTLTGIDGLLMRGRELIAVQNGVIPNRIVRLTLDAAGDSVVGAEIVLRDPVLAAEPTHAVLVGDTLYAIGNAGWNKYGDDGVPVTGVPRRPPALVRLTLRPAGRR